MRGVGRHGWARGLSEHKHSAILTFLSTIAGHLKFAINSALFKLTFVLD